MKFLDERGRVFGKINIFDLLAAAVLVIGILFVGLWLVKEEPAPEPTPAPETVVKTPDYYYATYKIKITGLRDYMIENLNEGDAVYEEGVEIGIIKKIDAEKQRVDTLQEDGSYKAVERKLYYDVILTIETDKYYEDNSRFVNGRSMLNGTAHSLTTGILPFDAVVRDVIVGELAEETEEKNESEEKGEQEE